MSRPGVRAETVGTSAVLGVARTMLFVRPGDRVMTDLFFLAVTVGFFALAIAYVHGCERL
jgi:hypothetical protein